MYNTVWSDISFETTFFLSFHPFAPISRSFATNIDYFYHRCATEGGSQPLRTSCSLCCKNNDDDIGVGIVRSCADKNDNIHDCQGGTLAQSCVCGTNLCNDVCDGCNSNELKCYDCNPQDSWCNNMDEVLDHGDEAQKICSARKCLISSK